MQQRRHPPALGGQAVVFIDRRAGFLLGDFDVALRQEGERFGGGLQPELASPAEHHDLRRMLEQLFHVGGLDAGLVLSSRLVPVPGSASAGPELGVSKPSHALDLDVSPTVVADLR